MPQSKPIWASNTIQTMIAGELTAVAGYLTGTIDQETLITTSVLTTVGFLLRIKTSRPVKLPRIPWLSAK